MRVTRDLCKESVFPHLARGEAAEPGKDGKLPRKATHAIIKKQDGTLKFKRDKFKLF